MQHKVREPAVAGMFYPAEAEALRGMVDKYLEAAPAPAEAPPKALIAPHAGLPYSGPVAATAYRTVAPLRGTVKRVVLLGPSHRVPFRGLAAPDADALRTPLGDIPVDTDALAGIADLPDVGVLDAAHAAEHSLEVQLPFLQEVLGDFRIVPLVVGDADPETVAAVLERLWGGPETLIVVSSDLSHFHDYATANRLDEATARAITTLHPERVDHDGACGFHPVRGLLTSARRHGLTGELLDRRNSGDTAGPRDQVVGYGAFAFHEPEMAHG
ncbi:MAG: AmmeMemoRadiSam system protein B [Thiohalospira sp.]